MSCKGSRGVEELVNQAVMIRAMVRRKGTYVIQRQGLRPEEYQTLAGNYQVTP